MTQIYECMFLLDNDVVRAGWNDSKAYVAAIIKKHKGKVCSSRRWDERRLSYPIRKKNRATFLLTYCEIPKSAIQDLRRELDLSETIMRYMILVAAAVPATEIDLTREESGEDFQIPEVPDDSVLDAPVVYSSDDGEDSNDGIMVPDDLDDEFELSRSDMSGRASKSMRREEV